ncbi:hypothetical protein QQ054_10935 [Oscillatoria amoena NRMC-F 0135]|nr:hypothetical protein [Oscillatoria amoena NRMC-F 0135]
MRRISPEHFVEWTRKAKPQHHDVILSRRCNPGETAYVPAGLECALGQNLVLLRADGKKLFPPFLRWLVRGTDWGACASRVRPRASMPEGTTHSAQFARGQKWGRASCAVNPPHLLSYNL